MQCQCEQGSKEVLRKFASWIPKISSILRVLDLLKLTVSTHSTLRLNDAVLFTHRSIGLELAFVVIFPFLLVECDHIRQLASSTPDISKVRKGLAHTHCSTSPQLSLTRFGLT